MISLSDRLPIRNDAPGDVINLAGVRFIAGRYRYRGKFISKVEAMGRLETAIDDETERMKAIADREDLTAADIERLGASSLKKIVIAHTIIGAGGFESVTNADLGRAGSFLKKQYYAGKGDDGKKYGLRYLSRDWANGLNSPARLRARLEMFAKSGKTARSAAWAARQPQNRLYIRRLGPNEDHCKFCVKEARKPPRPIAEIPLIGCCPQCLTNCRCSIVTAPTRTKARRRKKK